jgi:hypothetical protein
MVRRPRELVRRNTGMTQLTYGPLPCGIPKFQTPTCACWALETLTSIAAMSHTLWFCLAEAMGLCSRISRGSRFGLPTNPFPDGLRLQNTLISGASSFNTATAKIQWFLDSHHQHRGRTTIITRRRTMSQLTRMLAND